MITNSQDQAFDEHQADHILTEHNNRLETESLDSLLGDRKPFSFQSEEKE